MSTRIHKGQDRKTIHEDYHQDTTVQFKKISRNNFTYRILIEKLDKHLNRQLKVLDIGCGAGTLDFYFADKVKSIKGLDISRRAIESCNGTKKILGVKNINFELSYFPREKPRGKFDLVIFTEIIEHLENDNLALQEINRALHSRGLLFLSTVSTNAPLYKLGFVDKFDQRVGHLRRYNLDELLTLIKRNGFIIKEVNKTEGIVRNFLFVNQKAGKLIRFIRFIISDIVTIIDNLTIPIFGESNYIIVAQKK